MLHLWWECPHCSTDIYRVNDEAAKECPDCKCPRPPDSVSWLTPVHAPSGDNRQRIHSRKAKARIRKKMELAEANRRIEQLQRQQDRRQHRHPQRTAMDTVNEWVTTDGDDAWANWRPRDRRQQEDETMQDQRYPWSRHGSSGASAAQAAGHLAPFIFTAVINEMITPAEAAYAHETGAAAFAVMFLAYVYKFLEGTKDVAAAVAENVVVMSDSITSTGIQQIEIAMPEISRIFVATFAAIVIVFSWIISKELRKRYG